MSGWRAPTGGRIDRTRPIDFIFDGRRFRGFDGDTLASALLAAGVRIIGRSFKYHRPRGLWGAGAEEPNAILDVTEAGHTTPNLRATTEPLREGLTLRSVNTWPNAAHDRLRRLDALQRFLPAGFYYKSFMRPDWMRWEPMIRRMAGLGRLDTEHEPQADNLAVNARAALLVIGAGPAGLAAARAAATRGLAVWLVDDQDQIGGSLRWRDGTIEGASWQHWAEDTLQKIQSTGGRVLLHTSVWGAFDHGLFALWERRAPGPDRLWRVRAEHTVLAAGAVERPVYFANNDLPGVLSADAALHYLRRYSVVCGRQVVVATGNDSAWPVASALAEIGCAVTLVDARVDGPPAPEGVAVRRGQRVTAAFGGNRVARVRLGNTGLEADTMLSAGGWTPSVHLFMQAGGKLVWNDAVDALLPCPDNALMQVAGAANGTRSLAAALAEGHAAGGGAGKPPHAEAVREWAILPMRPEPSLPGRQWIDLQNDVTLKDVALAAREGFTSVEHLKRYTTLGMATDQGRTSNFAGLAALAGLTERTITQTGTTSYRPPVVPVPLKVIAGRRRGVLFNPLKRLTLEHRHRAAGARFREYGGWLRPSGYFDAPYDVAEITCAQREARIARETVSLFDASPLGKLEIIGPGAAELLDFCFYTRMSTLAPGHARYGLMLSESGIVYDDGVTLRLAADRFVVSASSSHVAGVRLQLEEARQDRFDPSRVYIHDATAHWVTLTVAGPRARDVLCSAGLPLALDDETLPHMAVVEGQWEGRPLRVARVSFSGERSYEISVPARHGDWLDTRLGDALASLNGVRIGMEAMLILRAEKGYILIGKDTDGVTLPQDIGWAAPLARREDEFVGKRALFTPEATRKARRQLVGLRAEDASGEPLVAGAHLVPTSGARRSLGFVTSSYWSPTLADGVALALLEGGRARMGEPIGVFDQGALRQAQVVSICAVDPHGERLHA